MGKQLELFSVSIEVRSWCGHTWLICVWRSFDGQHLGEWLLAEGK